MLRLLGTPYMNQVHLSLRINKWWSISVLHFSQTSINSSCWWTKCSQSNRMDTGVVFCDTGLWCLNEDGKVSNNWVSIGIWEFYMFTFFNVHLYLVGFPCGNLHYNELRRILPCYISVQVLVLRWQWPLLAKYWFVCQFVWNYLKAVLLNLRILFLGYLRWILNVWGRVPLNERIIKIQERLALRLHGQLSISKFFWLLNTRGLIEETEDKK